MAYEFNGTSQYIHGTAPASVQAEPTTFACRYYTTRNTSGDTLVAVINPSNGNAWQLVLGGQVANDPIIIQKFGAGFAFASVGTFSTSTWEHAAGVNAATNSRTPYINGTAGTTNTGLVTVSNTTSFSVGADHRGASGQYYMVGRICEAAIWSAALTTAEVVSLSKGFKASRIRPQSLKVYIPMVRNLQELRDAIALTNANTATVTAHPRVY